MLPIEGYPSKELHAHGINTFTKPSDGSEWIYLVNHRSDGEWISIFKVIRNDKKEVSSLQFWASVSAGMDSANFNAVAPVPTSENGDFYMSKWVTKEIGKRHLLHPLPIATGISLFDRDMGKFRGIDGAN